jgi:hypothetical protein
MTKVASWLREVRLAVAEGNGKPFVGSFDLQLWTHIGAMNQFQKSPLTAKSVYASYLSAIR